MASECIQEVDANQWPVRRLGDLARVKGGKRMPAGTALVSTRTDHPYLRIVDFARGSIDPSSLQFVPNDVFPKIARYTIGSDDVYISIVGTIGIVGMIPESLEGASLTENAAKICEISGELLPHFLSAYLQSPIGQDQIAAMTVGSTQPKLALFRIADMTIPCPPLPVQEAITEIITSLERRVKLLLDQNRSLEAIARAIFKSWFVDFDPVRAKAEGREPEGMDAATAALFPNEFQESESGRIPRGWIGSPFSEIADVIYGAAFASKAFNTTGRGIPLIRIRDLKTMEPTVFTEENHPRGRLISAGDVVVGMDGEFRSYHWLGEPAWLNQRVCLFSPKRSYGRTFIREALIPLLAEVERGQVGTTVIHIGKADIDRFQTVTASTEVMNEFNQLTEPLLNRITCNAAILRSLTELRDTLLPRLISGTLRVPEAEKLVGAAL